MDLVAQQQSFPALGREHQQRFGQRVVWFDRTQPGHPQTVDRNRLTGEPIDQIAHLRQHASSQPQRHPIQADRAGSGNNRAGLIYPDPVGRRFDGRMALNDYVTLGRSGLRVSPFALGAMTFGEDPPGSGSSTAESETILKAYLDRGGNFIDTANFYTNGHAEAILGDFFASPAGAARPRRARIEVLHEYVPG